MSVYMSNKSRNLYHSGQGGGKTFLMGLISYRFVFLDPDAVGMIAANTYKQLSDSTLKEIFKVWKMMGISEYNKVSNPGGHYVVNKQRPDHFNESIHQFENNHGKVHFINGSTIVTASLDNYEAIEGQNLSWALLDETSSTKKEAVKVVITGRLRENRFYAVNNKQNPFITKQTAKDMGILHKLKPVNPLYVFTKPAKEQWLTDYFKLEKHKRDIEQRIFSETDYFEYKDNRYCIVVASTFHNIKNVGRDYIEGRLQELTKDESDLYIYGSPFGKTGNEYYSSFSLTKHVGKTFFNPDLPIHLTIDFNVNPYMSASVWQLEHKDDRIKLYCLQEYALKAPKNTVEDICDAVIDDYGHAISHLFYYGDSSGKNKLPIKEARTYYHIIEKKMFNFVNDKSRRLLTSNPRHKSLLHGRMGRRDFMNATFRGLYGVDITIDDSCTYMKADLNYILEDKNGAKQKHEETVDGIRCQRLGHMSDGADALICYLFGDYKKEKQ